MIGGMGGIFRILQALDARRRFRHYARLRRELARLMAMIRGVGDFVWDEGREMLHAEAECSIPASL